MAATTTHQHQLCQGALYPHMQEEERTPQTDYADRSVCQKGDTGGVNTLISMGYGMHVTCRNDGGPIHPNIVESKQYFRAGICTPHPGNQHIQTRAQGVRDGVHSQYGPRVG